MDQEVIGFVIVIVSIYSIWLTVMLINWWLIKPTTISEKTDASIFSIIIPFRNETSNLPFLIQSLSSLNLDRLQTEIILINDHSEDDFLKFINETNQNFHWYSLPQGMTGKKAALNYGVKKAKGNIIITSDADCQFHQNWVQIIASYFNSENIQMVFGGVGFKRSGFFEGVQQIEFAPLIGAGAASLNLGLPIMCNGANLAFRKSAFARVGGYEGNEHIASGDDEFLLSKITKVFPGQIQFLKHTDAVVVTNACKNLKEFYNQRKRWAGKWSSNKHWYKSLLAILIFLSAISSLYMGVSLCITPNTILLFLFVFKILLEGVFIHQVLILLNRPFNIKYFLFVQIFYPFYAIIFGVVANFGKYTWKGRRH